MYVELHAHSHFSFLDGASSPEALVERAAALGMPALALTDHDGLYGAMRFWQAAKEHGPKAIIGAEVTVESAGHLTLLVETSEGYANLSRLLSHAYLHDVAPRRHSERSEESPSAPGYFVALSMTEESWPGKTSPKMTWEMLQTYSRGLIALSGCRRGVIAAPILADERENAQEAAGRLREVFGQENVFVELQRHLLPDEPPLLRGLMEVALRVELPLVATNNVHYATRAEHRLQHLVTCIRELTTLEDAHARGLLRPNSECYLKSAAEMEGLFAGVPDALANTLGIAERCNVSLDFSSQRLPLFPVPDGETQFSVLYGLCYDGLRRKYQPVTPAASRQLARELDLIERVGLAGYFLMVRDICRFAHEAGIRYQGRGSAANSIVAYVLDITPVDPLQFNLLFERFLSEDRHTMPDIDIDFAADRREEVIQYVYARYGRAHTGMVCNVVTFGERMARRDVARALGLTPAMIKRMEKAEGGEDAEDTDPTRRMRAAVEELCQGLVDAPRHLSIHSGGMLMTAAPLVEVVPVERATMPGRVVVQWNKDDVEDAGLIKLDLLGLRMLGLVDEALRLVEARTGQAPDLAHLPLDDPRIYAMLCAGDTVGAFQVESRAQISMLPRLKPQCFDDIVVAVSIVRPGPIQGGMVHPYLRRRAGLEPVAYAHSSLEPILHETLGVILFQEQVLRVAMAIAGFTGGEADALRRAMSRHRSGVEMARLRGRFLEGASANGVDEATANEVFDQLAAFASYGFCKSHAAAFAHLAYQSLWLKAYHPAEFYCALLNGQPMGFYAPEVIMGDARRHGVPIRHADVNHSNGKCTLEGQAIRLGLCYVHGFGPAAQERLLDVRAERPFDSLADLCHRTHLPRGLVETLIRAGALNELGGGEGGRRQLLWALGALDYREEALALDAPVEAAALPELGEAEAMGWEYELLGMAPGDHILRLYRPRLKADGFVASADLGRRRDGEMVRVAGLVVVRQRPPTAKGHAFFTLEDETGLINLIARPDLFERRRDAFNAPLLAARGRLQHEGLVTSIVVQDVWLLDPP
ncbi:MAG: error-prone DNA polymerase [Anaerolineae bacterium]